MKTGRDYQGSRHLDLDTTLAGRRRLRSESSIPAPGNHLDRQKEYLLQSACRQAPEAWILVADKRDERIGLIHSRNDSVEEEE